jgi:GTPase SAR1 family protein
MTIVLDDNEFLKPDIFGLQQDVITCLAEIAELMGKARDLLGKENALDNSSANYGQYQQEIYDARRNVEQLELRMAVVAPMKAGKSTIINAIIGQELLPSRNAAMTTLPTEIVFKRDLAEPCLIISDEVRQTFQSAIESIRQEIKGLGKEAIREKISQYPHLVELIQDIEANQFQIPSNNLSGQERITKVLTSFNDIVRLCSVINPLQDPLAYLTEVIRLETPYLHAEDDRQQEKLGNLVIIDTPGPNEAGENLRLTMVVEDQLKNSAVVLIVLDFTQLNNEAAEKVKKQVQPIIDLIGKNNLYVLINKIDQRRKGDMNPEQVKEFVYADLNLSESIHTDKIFEISAVRAFSAARFMLERQCSDSVSDNYPATALKSAETLAQEVYGIDWEEDLNQSTVTDLYAKADRLWKKSGFSSFLDKAINALMTNVAPYLINSSLNKARNRLIAMREDVSLRGQAINRAGDKLHQDIELLEADLKRLELCRIKLGEVENIRSLLQNRLDKVLNQLKKEAQVSIEDYFGKEDYQRANALEKVDISMRNIFLTPISNFDPFGFSAQLKQLLGRKPSDILDFDTQQQANDFANDATAWAKQRAEKMLFSTRRHITEEIDTALSSLKKSLDRETLPIIEKARERLKQTFGVELALPEMPSLDGNLGSEIQVSVNQSTRQKTIQRSDKKRRWYVLWLVEIEHKWKEVIDEHYYLVSLKTLTKSFNVAVSEKIDILSKEIKTYLEEDFKDRMDTYFKELDQYLRRYQDSLKQSQQDQKLSFEEKKQLMADLDSMLPLINKNVKKTEIILERNKQIISSPANM